MKTIISYNSSLSSALRIRKSSTVKSSSFCFVSCSAWYSSVASLTDIFIHLCLMPCLIKFSLLDNISPFSSTTNLLTHRLSSISVILIISFVFIINHLKPYICHLYAFQTHPIRPCGIIPSLNISNNCSISLILQS